MALLECLKLTIGCSEIIQAKLHTVDDSLLLQQLASQSNVLSFGLTNELKHEIVQFSIHCLHTFSTLHFAIYPSLPYINNLCTITDVFNVALTHIQCLG